jgi:signal transduction histidine kinase
MFDRIPVTSWFPPQELTDCPLCRDATAVLSRDALRVAGDIALAITTRGHVGRLAEAVVERLGATLGAGRASVLVPEPAGRWRVFASSERGHAHDLVVDAERYPELAEVRRTGAPFIARDVETSAELEPARAVLQAAGVRCVAAYPIFLATGRGDAVVLKITLHRQPEPAELLLATLIAHLLVHRLGGMQPARVAHQLGVSVTPSDGYDPATLLRLLPIAALVVDGTGRVLHANNRAVWLLHDREQGSSNAAITLSTRPERCWLATSGRWEAHLLSGNGEMPVLGWSNLVGAERTLVLIEPHPAARHTAHERQMRRTLAEKLEELEAANIRLEEHARSRERFVSDAAHELKTPLAILRSYLETMSDDLADGLSAQQREFLQAATHGAGRLQRLVEEMLDLAALEGGHLPLVLGQVPVRDAAQPVLDELAPLAAQGGVALRCEPGEPLVLRADVERLRQVLRNLVENGLKYTEPGGAVVVSWRRQGDSAVVAVCDTGVGIAAKALPRIFDEFVRVNGRRAVDGAGLGLGIVRRLVQAMGGQVWAESRPGAGSRFLVELPLWTGEG